MESQNIITTDLVINDDSRAAKEHDFPIRGAIKGILWNASLWNDLGDFELFTMTADSVILYYLGSDDFNDYNVVTEKEENLYKVNFRHGAYILTIKLI
tara:strand:+ start:139 stop:432 length:294 start_codon:yes stop_codon:yes gene_type:complete